MGAPPRRHEMRPYCNGTSPAAWNELSRRHAIEMQPSFPDASTPATTHVRRAPSRLAKQPRESTVTRRSHGRHIGRPHAKAAAPVAAAETRRTLRRRCWAATTINAAGPCLRSDRSTLRLRRQRFFREQPWATYGQLNPHQHDEGKALAGGADVGPGQPTPTRTGRCRRTFSRTLRPAVTTDHLRIV